MAGRSKKTNPARRYNGGGARPDKTKFRQEEAVERAAVWAALSPSEKLAALDARLGVGVGAVAQRAKLAKLLEAKSTKTVEVKS